MLVDPNYVNRLASFIDQSSLLEDQLTSELSSGLRVTSLQTDPVAAAQSALINSAISRDDNYIQAASGTKSMLQVTDSTLGEIVSQLTSAVSLAVQGNSGTLSGSNLSAVSQQLADIRDQVVSLANTSYLGGYLFSGSQGVKPFATNSSTTPATTTYSGDASIQSILTPTGQAIQTNIPGSAIFGTSGFGVFAALNQLIADFSSGTASPSAAADIASLTSGLNQVSSQRSVLDSSLSRIESTSTYTSSDEAQLTAERQSLIGADITSVVTELKSAETQHEALLSVANALGGVNLFSFMK